MSENRKGCPAWNKGKHWSDKVRKNIGDGLRGKPQSKESNLKRSLTLKGRIFTDEHRKKLSESAKKRKRNKNGKLKKERK